MKNRMISGKWLIGLTFIFFPSFTVFAQEVGFEDKFPIELSDNKGTRSELIVYLTGDGGWNRFSRNLVNEFEKQGYGVVSLNSFEYFGTKNPLQILPLISDKLQNII